MSGAYGRALRLLGRVAPSGGCTLSLLACLALLGGAARLAAQQEIPLNSERIEMRFGSYGLEVLEQDAELRVSNLYSEADGAKVTRTFAVVTYPERLDPSFAAEHEAILAGGSIGAVFAAGGWLVHKRNRFIGTTSATETLRAMMQEPDAAELATHVYLLEVERGGQRFDYALITEIHHPDYLSAREIAAIYGPVPELSAAAQRALDAALAQARAAAGDRGPAP